MLISMESRAESKRTPEAHRDVTLLKNILSAAVLGLLLHSGSLAAASRASVHCGVWTLPEVSSPVERGPLASRASGAVAPGLWHTGLVVQARGPSCSAGMWDLPGPGIEPVSLALQRGFLTTGPPGKP